MFHFYSRSLDFSAIAILYSLMNVMHELVWNFKNVLKRCTSSGYLICIYLKNKYVGSQSFNALHEVMSSILAVFGLKL